MKTIKYTDGELILQDDGSMTAIGEFANKVQQRIWRVLDKKAITRENSYSTLSGIFDGINNCTIF